jgi:hypothetical protein
MGDRAMAEIKTQDGSIYVYTHCGGFDLPDTAKEAVKSARPRWEDEPYATHIIVDQLIKDGRDSETGFGIMLKPDVEDEYNDDKPSVIIDLTTQTLTIIREGVTKVTKFSEINIADEEE